MVTLRAVTGSGVSVVIPAWRAMATLPQVLDALVPQASGHEIIVVESSGDGSGDLIRDRWPMVRVIEPEQRAMPGRARNIGAAAARGEVLVFLDADAVPEPGWLDALIQGLSPLSQGVAAGVAVGVVAGVVANGTPRSAVGTAGWYLEFSEVRPGDRARVLHGTSANLAVRRSDFDRVGGFTEELFPGEDTILTRRLAGTAGVAFAPRAIVRHLNRTGLREFLAHQARLGRSAGAVFAATPQQERRAAGFLLSHPMLAPIAAAGRLLALVARVEDRWALVKVGPLVVLGLAAWSVGLARGDHST